MAETQTSPEMLEMLAPLLHGLIALWGLLDCFFGFRIFRLTVRILVAVMVAALGASMAVHYYPESLTALGGFSLGGLVVGALLGWYLYKMAVFVMGFLTGAMLATPFMASAPAGWEWAVPLAGGAVAGLLAFLLVNLMIIAGTSLTGAFRLVFGVAFYFGGPSLVTSIQNPQAVTLVVQDHPFLFAGTLAVAAIGFILQWSTHRKRASKD